jgi:hypothetical protein
MINIFFKHILGNAQYIGLLTKSMDFMWCDVKMTSNYIIST